MSIPVELPDLQAKIGEYGWAYLLTVRDNSTPHIVSVAPEWDGDALVMPVGNGTAKNTAARSSISLCYPPTDAADYSLIIDGTATPAPDQGDRKAIRFTPSGAVLHRNARPDFEASATGCANDCLPVDGTS